MNFLAAGQAHFYIGVLIPFLLFVLVGFTMDQTYHGGKLSDFCFSKAPYGGGS